MTQPFVSIIIPTYNCAPYLREAIDSVLAQTYRRFEIIVVDDGSTDTTREVLASYQEHQDRILYLSQPKRGPAAARNLAIRHARGELIGLLDADDAWLPDKLELVIQALAVCPEAGLVFTDTEYLVRQPEFREWIRRNSRTDLFAAGWLYQALLHKNCIGGATSVCIPRARLEAVGEFDETLRRAAEYELWLRIAQRSPVVFVKRILNRYRVRSDSQSGPVGLRLPISREAGAAVLERHFPMIPEALKPLTRARITFYYWNGGWHYFSLNRFHEARRMFRRSLRSNWRQPVALLYLSASYLPAWAVERLRALKRWLFPNLKHET